MDEITRTREEVQRDVNKLNETIIENLISAHVAATLAAPQVKDSTVVEAVARYRAILSEIYKLGPFKGAAE